MASLNKVMSTPAYSGHAHMEAEPGSLCCAYSSIDERWYRVSVVPSGVCSSTSVSVLVSCVCSTFWSL